MSYGAQHVLIVMTWKMADAAGLKVKRFKNDPKADEEIPDDSLVFIDGNGRIDYLLGVDKTDWPNVYAVFPTKDAAGFYNLNISFDVINTQVSVWKTKDMVLKRILTDGSQAHPGWKMINQLIKRGYNYQAACQLATLGTDRITKAKVNNESADDIFTNYEYAIEVYEAEKKKFGEGKDKTLKTKAFTKELSTLWRKFTKKYSGDEATKLFIDFINQIPEKTANSIKKAQSKKGGMTKDDIRISLLDNCFNKFVETQHIKLN